jgi:hypothetical protein
MYTIKFEHWKKQYFKFSSSFKRLKCIYNDYGFNININVFWIINELTKETIPLWPLTISVNDLSLKNA